MSAPDTNIERQKRRHWPVITGIVAAVLLSTVAFMTFLASDQSAPEEPAATATN
jgi:hypothetical protein